MKSTKKSHDTESVSGMSEKSTDESIPQLSSAAGLSFIEQLQISSSKPCKKDKVPYLIGVNNETKNAVLSKAACKMWDCDACGARLAKTWIARIINGINKIGGRWSFLTLTAHRKFRQEASVRNLRDGWKKFYNRLLSYLGKEGKDFHYCKVWEQHKDGSFHLHILLDCFISERWAKDSASECGMGYQVEWHEVENAGIVAGYIAKYTLKNSSISRAGVTIPKGLRRVETSLNWPKLPDLRDNSAINWEIYFDRDEQVRKAGGLYWLGYDVVDLVKENGV